MWTDSLNGLGPVAGKVSGDQETDLTNTGINVPIIPGVMPIQNFASFRRLVNLTKCPVPDSILLDLEPIKVRQILRLDSC